LGFQPFLITYFNTLVSAFVLIPMNLNETTRLVSQLPPLPCCCAHHCQLSQALLLLNGLVHFHIVWNGLAFKHVMYLMFPEVFVFYQKALYIY